MWALLPFVRLALRVRDRLPPYQSRGDALRDDVKSLVELLHFGPHLGLAVLPPGGHELLGQSVHLLHLGLRNLKLGTQHLQDTDTHSVSQRHRGKKVKDVKDAGLEVQWMSCLHFLGGLTTLSCFVLNDAAFKFWADNHEYVLWNCWN